MCASPLSCASIKMAKSIRSKVKKRNRSYMRKTVGEKVRTANIEAAAARMERKRNGRANTMTLIATKGALNRVDLGKAYYEAVVRPVTEVIPEVEPMEEEPAPEEPVKEDTSKKLEEDARLQSQLTGVLPSSKKVRFQKKKLRGVFSKRPKRSPTKQTTKELVSF